jgi:putative endonuclease
LPAVYILASGMYGTLYVGFAYDLVKRVWEHKSKFVKGFTSEHDVNRLVWYEIHESVIEARTREKQIKKWNRDWKINLIQEMNPTWKDLYVEFSA